MLLDPRTPLIIGAILVLAVVGLLAYSSPSPGSLSAAHARVAELSTLDGCASCHHEAGMTQGCLGCHREIAAQLSGGGGYHHHLTKTRGLECAGCHVEHCGRDFEIVNDVSWGAQTRAAFRHPHVAFTLTGKHERLSCEDCHDGRRDEPFHLPGYPFFAREHTFLGLAQECDSCHEDLHSGGLTGDCAACHGQEAFRPTVSFDHDRHFALDGAHDRLACAKCHLLPHPGDPRSPLPFPFDRVWGKTCVECHESPHLAAFREQCDGCHPGSEPEWIAARGWMSPERHAATGFHLIGAHANVGCDGCHLSTLPYGERHPDPSTAEYRRREDTCEGCHRDVHGGQFQERRARCVDCHNAHGFQPSTFGHGAHASVYPLTGAHVAVPCLSCHAADGSTGVRKFIGTAHQCKACHEDPHAGQFDREIASGDCDSCHRTESFRVRPFDHEGRTGFRLTGAHATADCRGCHVEATLTSGVETRRFTGTPKRCASCHRDVHRGQFGDRFPDCDSCHVSSHRWSEVRFDHDAWSRFPLEGAHARVECSRCHLPLTLEDGTRFVRYRPLDAECGDCHEVDARLRTRKTP